MVDDRAGVSYLESQANWDLFRVKISTSVLGCPLSEFASRSLEEMSRTQEQWLVSASIKSMRQRKKFKERVWWWSKELDTLRRQIRKARRNLR